MSGTATANGKAWEAQLIGWHEEYRKAGRALVVKSPPPMKLTSGADGDGRFLATFHTRGPVDFTGVLAGGRAVFLEAKSSASQTWEPWGRGGLKAHQASMLRQAAALGALAFVALRTRAGDFVIPISAVFDAPAGARWTTADLHTHGRPMGRQGWIDVVS